MEKRLFICPSCGKEISSVTVYEVNRRNADVSYTKGIGFHTSDIDDAEDNFIDEVNCPNCSFDLRGEINCL